MKHFSRVFLSLCLGIGLPVASFAAGVPAHIEPYGTTSLSMIEGQNKQLFVFVTDSAGNPVLNPAVQWSGPSAGPRAIITPFSYEQEEYAGLAGARLASTGGEGSFQITATLSGVGSVVFQITNLPLGISVLEVVSGAVQSTPINTPFPEPVVIQARRLGGSPAVGFEIYVVGDLSGSNRPSILPVINVFVTDAQGRITVPLAANGSPGVHVVEYQALDSFGEIIHERLQLSNLPAAPTALEYVSGSGQTLTRFTPAGVAARVLGPGGSPMANVAVDFKGPDSGPGAGDIYLVENLPSTNIPGGARILTNASGVASLAPAANAQLGPWTFVASTSLVSTTIPFELTNVLPEITAVRANGRTAEQNPGVEAPIGGRFDFLFLVLGPDGPIPGVRLTLTTVPVAVGDTGATIQLDSTTIETDEEGIARGSGIANGIPGFHYVRAEAPTGQYAFLYMLNQKPGLGVGDQLLDLPATDHLGAARSLRSLLSPGRFLIFDMCTNWCTFCKRAQPFAQAAKTQLAAMGIPVAFVPVMAEGSTPGIPSVQSDALSWFQTYRITDLVLHVSGDSSSLLSKAIPYILSADHAGYPTYLLVGPDGNILDNHSGIMDTAQMVEFVLAHVPGEISATNVSVSEGAGVANVMLSRTRAGGAASVNFATSFGTATGADFTSRSGVVNFEPGQDTAFLAIPILNDLADEPNETFTVTLSNPSDATLARSQATVTIGDDDAPSAISIDDLRITEGTGSTTIGKVTARLDRPSGFTVGVSFSMIAGTAKSTDVALTSGKLSFAPGQTTQTIEVAIVGDKLVEGKETFTVKLATPSSATLLDPEALISIIDDDADTTPPVIEAVKDVVVEVKMASSAFVIVNYTEPLAKDNRDGAIDVACVAPSGLKRPYGKELVTCTAEDKAGNLATRTFQIVVRTPTVAGALFDPRDRNTPITDADQGDRVLVVVNAGAFASRARVALVLIDATGRRHALGDARAERDGSLNESIEIPDRAARGVAQVLAESEGSAGEYDRAWFLTVTDDDHHHHHCRGHH